MASAAQLPLPHDVHSDSRQFPSKERKNLAHKKPIHVFSSRIMKIKINRVSQTNSKNKNKSETYSSTSSMRTPITRKGLCRVQAHVLNHQLRRKDPGSKWNTDFPSYRATSVGPHIKHFAGVDKINAILLDITTRCGNRLREAHADKERLVTTKSIGHRNPCACTRLENLYLTSETCRQTSRCG